jgi:hypothetical protein
MSVFNVSHWVIIYGISPTIFSVRFFHKSSPTFLYCFVEDMERKGNRDGKAGQPQEGGATAPRFPATVSCGRLYGFLSNLMVFSSNITNTTNATKWVSKRLLVGTEVESAGTIPR